MFWLDRSGRKISLVGTLHRALCALGLHEWNSLHLIRRVTWEDEVEMIVEDEKTEYCPYCFATRRSPADAHD